MTFKLWLLSLILSTLAPFIIPKNKPTGQTSKGGEDPNYQPGKYFDHTMS